MSLPHPLPDQIVELLARRLHALADPTRIRLIDHLLGGEATVQELTDRLHTTQQNVSKHLAVLHRTQIVARERSGRLVCYRLIGSDALAILEAAAGGSSTQPGEPGDGGQSD